MKSIKLGFLPLATISALLFVALAARETHAQAYATPTTYQITVQQVELCEDIGCASSVVIGTSTKDFDIASQSAGADIGSYANTDGLTPGTTYSAVKVTLSRTIVMSGTTGDPGGIGGTCDTDSADDGGSSAAYGTLADGDEADGNGDGAEDQTLIAPNPTGTTLGDISSGYTNNNFTISNGVAGMTVTYPLTSSYTVGYVQPRVQVTFDVTNSLGSVNDGANNCEMFPAAPIVNVTVSDPS